MFGRTGTGKTTLIRSFLDELLERDEAVVLSGRCYERESVPYKALDSLIDSLARYLKGLPTGRVRAAAAARMWRFWRGRFRCCRVSRRSPIATAVRRKCLTSKSCAGEHLPGCASS